MVYSELIYQRRFFADESRQAALCTKESAAFGRQNTPKSGAVDYHRRMPYCTTTKVVSTRWPAVIRST